jgi:hypothetical protein
MRDVCDRVGISYSHFYGMRGVADDEFRASVAGATSWSEVLAALGYAAESGSARSSVRRRAADLGIDVTHLGLRCARDVTSGPFAGTADARHLRSAAAFLVAAQCALRGYAVSWPLEPTAYDLLVDAGTDGLLRVQVKSSTRRVDGSWIAWITRGSNASTREGTRRSYSAEEIDYFGVVDGEQRVYMIPVNVVEGRKALTLRAYEAYALAT